MDDTQDREDRAAQAPSAHSGVAALAFWGKSPRGGQPAHQLLAHMLDTGACTLALLSKEPVSSRDQFGAELGLDTAVATRWVALLCALHDLGKGTPAFLLGRGYTAGDEDLRQVGLLSGDSTRPPLPPAHGELSQQLVAEVLESLGWFPLAAEHAAEAVGIHHGLRFGEDSSGRRRSTQQLGGMRWKAARTYLVTTLVDAFGLYGALAPTVSELSAAAFSRLAGCASVADWIASSLKYGRDASDASAYLAEAQVLAECRLREIGWLSRRPLLDRPTEFSALFPLCNPPNPLQQTIAELLADAEGPCLFIVEAPMGEGKTEAAFYAHACLQQRNDHRGLYLALPTQATGNSAFVRMRNFLSQFGQQLPLDLQLLHGGAALNAEFRALKIPTLSGIEGAEPDESSESAGVQAREWFSQSRRALLSEYGVGTVDQALLSILNVRHYFVRLWGLANRVVVIDEVHAYDWFTGSLIATLLSWLRALNSSVIVMSATLPATIRKRLLQAWGHSDNACTLTYPRISRIDAQGIHTRTFATRQLPANASQVRIHRLTTDIGALAATALEHTVLGGCALIVVNTVKRAQQLYLHLRKQCDAACELLLFHSRFPAEQRERIEIDLRKRFGPDGRHRPVRAIVVATQVCEQSLDVDFDLLISDLAPVDLILQRIGRVHRHNRQRPAHLSVPNAWVAGIANYPERPALETHHWHEIYNTAVLLASAHYLSICSQIEIPGDIDELVQRAYRRDENDCLIVTDWPTSWQSEGMNLVRKLRDQEREHAQLAEQFGIGVPNDENSWTQVRRTRRDSEDDAQVHVHLRASTRLGDPPIKVVFLYETDHSLALDADGRRPVPSSGELSEELATDLYTRCVSIANKWHVRAIQAADNPRYLRGTPLLRQVYVARMQADGSTRLGIRLDPELGVVA